MAALSFEIYLSERMMILLPSSMALLASANKDSSPSSNPLCPLSRVYNICRDVTL